MRYQLFTSLNMYILCVAFGVLGVGYWAMGQGPITNPLSMSVAPFLLVLAYCGIIPAAILVRSRNKSDNQK